MEGIIKAVTVEPVKLYPNQGNESSALVKIYYDAAALAAMYEAAGIDPETVTASYIVYSEQWGWDLERINLATAVETGHEVSMVATLGAAFINSGGE